MVLQSQRPSSRAGSVYAATEYMSVYSSADSFHTFASAHASPTPSSATEQTDADPSGASQVLSPVKSFPVFTAASNTVPTTAELPVHPLTNSIASERSRSSPPQSPSQPPQHSAASSDTAPMRPYDALEDDDSRPTTPRSLQVAAEAAAAAEEGPEELQVRTP